jgi:hypothetical protein
MKPSGLIEGLSNYVPGKTEENHKDNSNKYVIIINRNQRGSLHL